jgi:hypothetical protein
MNDLCVFNPQCMETIGQSTCRNDTKVVSGDHLTGLGRREEEKGRSNLNESLKRPEARENSVLDNLEVFGEDRSP